jgi:hypothetical protein
LYILSAHIFRTLVLTAAILLTAISQLRAQQQPAKPDTLRYPIKDRYGDPYSNPNRNSFELRDTGYLKRSIEYDPLTGEYYIIEKIGNLNYRIPDSIQPR